MGIAQFLASFRRKPNTNARKQESNRQGRIHAPQCQPPLLTPPAPVASVRSRCTANVPAIPDPIDIVRNFPDVPSRIPRPRLPAAGGRQGLVRRGIDIPPANLDAQGDLGLVRFDGELFLPPSPVAEPAIVATDAGYGEKEDWA
ncbi:MAG: hypothetical protein Q9184_008314 [Pyrenodesmia sp. 2 TL-2023]